MRRVVEAVFAETNRQGGIYRRELVLEVSSDADLLAPRTLALVAGHADAWPQGIPVVGPLGFAAHPPGPERPVFHLVPGFEDQGRLAVLHAGAGPLRLATAPGPETEAWAHGIREEARRRGIEVASSSAQSTHLVSPSSGEPSELRIVPATLAGRPSTTAVLPIRPSDERFAAFLRRHGMEPTFSGLQAQAFAAARVLVEGLRRAGATPTRAKLIAGLETIREFDTWVTPPVSFGPNRRTGAEGAWLVAFDERSRIVRSQWVPLAPHASAAAELAAPLEADEQR